MTVSYVPAADFESLKREHEALKATHARTEQSAHAIRDKAYAEGRDDARREALRGGSRVEHGNGLAHLYLPDNGGCIQFHAVGPSGPRPLTGGLLTPAPDFSLRIWGPPDPSGRYGIHEQGGDNITDFSMQFDLTPAGMVIHRMGVKGVRTRYDR
jgi:hypothetical protein